MNSLVSAAMLLSALALAPMIGGGLGELASGTLQILVFAAIAWHLFRSSQSWTKPPGSWFLLAFLALAAISTAQSRAIYFSLNHLLFMLACLGGFLLSATLCRNNKLAAAAVWALVLSALFVSGSGVRGYILDAGGGAGFWTALTSSGDHSRLFGPFVNPNFFAGYLVIALPVTLALYLATRRSLIAALPAVALISELMALMLTGAKFGVIAAAAALILFVLLAIATRSLDRSRLARLLIITLVVIPLLIPFSAPFKSRVRQAQVGGTQVHSTAFRFYTWKATLNMIKAQPLLGVGPGVYGITYPRYTIAGPTKHAHNSYLQIAAETGVPALIAFVGLLLAVACRSLAGIFRRSDEQTPNEPNSDSVTWRDFVPSGGWKLVSCGIFAALVGSSVRGMVDSDWHIIGIALPFWVLAGLLVSKSGAAQRDMTPGRVLRPALIVTCVIAVVLSAGFAVGDYWASRAREAASANDRGQAVELYARAVSASPLNPEYHRQLGLWLGLGQGEFLKANTQIDKSISLARNTAEGGWKARGMLASAQRDWPLAISSLRKAASFNPNSTDTLSLLASAYQSSGHTGHYEATLRRLLAVEKSPYEQIKGTPEIVDTTYATAHVYFGRAQLERKNYATAAAEFAAAVDRLELWRASGDMRELQRIMGMSNEAEDRRRIDLLRECYKGLADAYSAMGSIAEADKALEKMRKVK